MGTTRPFSYRGYPGQRFWFLSPPLASRALPYRHYDLVLQEHGREPAAGCYHVPFLQRHAFALFCTRGNYVDNPCWTLYRSCCDHRARYRLEEFIEDKDSG